MANEILPFATDAGANVATQAEYEAAVALVANGFQAGIANSALLNKVWRQSAFIASTIAQFIVDTGGVDVLDNGDVPALVTKFTDALTVLIQSASPKTLIYCGTSAGSANTQTLTPSPAITAYGTGVPGYILLAGYTNTGALTVNISGLGAKEVRKDSPSGLIALTGGEVYVGSMCLLRYDGTYLRLEDSQLGSAALMNASNGTPGGTVASVSGSTVAGHLAVFTDTAGTVGDGGAPPALATVATTGAYADLTGKPTLATVATTGAFADLVSKPTTLAGYGITDGNYDPTARSQLAVTNLRLLLNSAVSTGALLYGKQWELASDEWGATSTNEGYVSGPPGYYLNVGSSGQLAAAVTSISGGDDTSGGESQAQAYDGNLSTLWRSLQSGAGAYNTAYLGQDFGAGNLKNITQAYFNQGFSGNASHGATDIALQSSDDGAAWTIRASITGQSQVQGWVTINSAYGGYHRYWRLTPTAGLVNTWRIQELQMTGVGQALNMTLIPPASVSLSAVPTYANLYFLWKDDDGTSVLGTDITVEISRDGGTTWTAAGTLVTLLGVAGFDGTYTAIQARVDLSAQPSGTSLLCRIKTFNTKAQRVAAPALYAE
jgi:hypothetical protein